MNRGCSGGDAREIVFTLPDRVGVQATSDRPRAPKSKICVAQPVLGFIWEVPFYYTTGLSFYPDRFGHCRGMVMLDQPLIIQVFVNI